MFCPRCGTAVAPALEFCSKCRVDLRPIAATGFYSSPLVPGGAVPAAPEVVRPTERHEKDGEETVLFTGRPPAATGGGEETVLFTGPRPTAATGEEAEETVLFKAPPRAPAGGEETVLFTGAPPAADGEETVLFTGTVPASAGEETMLAGPAFPGAGDDSEATRLGPPIPKPRTGRPGSSGSRRLILGRSLTPSGAPRPPTDPSVAMSTGGPLATGENFGTRYHIIRLLGIGGMGAVYQAWDSELEVALAVKVIRPDATNDPVAAAEIEGRFKRELLLARQVTHPNVVRIHDLGEIDGIKYITMPYIEGKDLSDILAESGTLPVPRVLSIAKQVVSGLAAAHEAGVVHRDLKPPNIMIDAEDRALIMDFGIARTTAGPADPGTGGSLSHAADAGATRIGTIVGTIEYMAPEQAKGQAVDHRADIYAFGMILSRMLVGKRWAEGATALTDLQARMQEAPAPLRQHNPDIPEAVEQIVTTCLQVDPDARYATTGDLLHALERLDENGIPLPEPIPIWRSWKAWTAAAALMLVLVAGTSWITQFFTAVEAPREPVSVLIADFVNQTGDPMFNGLLEQPLTVGLEGATFITAYERRDALRVARGLNAAGKTLDENTARLVAQREGVKVLLAGAVVSDGGGYKLSIRGINLDASSTAKNETPAAIKNEVLLTSETRAANKNEVLNAIGRLAADVRKSLGDTKTKRNPAANEMLSAASLEAVAEYFKGQELTRQAKDAEGIEAFRKATELDENFGRAYSAWATAASRLGRTDEAKKAYDKALSLLDRMTERERYRTLGVYYVNVTKDYAKGIDEYKKLVGAYPSDAVGYNNLAVAYALNLQFAEASAMGRKALEILPKNRKYRSNFALYAMYAGDFKAAATEAEALVADDPKYFEAYLPLAISALADGKRDLARDYYQKMAAVGAQGESKANIGLADIAILEGRTTDAIALLTKGIDEDEATKNTGGATVKRMAIAEAYENDANIAAAVRIAQSAVEALQTEAVLVPASRVFATARWQREMDQVAKHLANQFEPQKRAYARIVDALDFMSRERYVDAVDSLKASIQFADLWLARYYLGVAYETAGRHAEAISELLTCQKRRGEATSIFIDDVPTYRYLGPLPYWLARAQAGLGQTAQAKANFQAFLEPKQGAPSDPLVADARERLAALTKTGERSQ
jgi:serine/threonine protein kinase/tetratricopeptide (TPR) repeat protein